MELVYIALFVGGVVVGYAIGKRSVRNFLQVLELLLVERSAKIKAIVEDIQQLVEEIKASLADNRLTASEVQKLLNRLGNLIKEVNELLLCLKDTINKNK